LAAARQLLLGRCPFRGEWERIPCFFWKAHALRSRSEKAFPKKIFEVTELLNNQPFFSVKKIYCLFFVLFCFVLVGIGHGDSN
jgi:hypothetical protein